MPGNAKKIVLFDGVCNLCSGSVQFILRRDRRQQFMFASLQGNAGRELLNRFNLPPNDLNSFVLIESDRAYTRSTAALRMAKHLGGVWQLAYAFIIIPRPIRDAVYKLIARNRYRWFGKKKECWIPSPKWRSAFLDEVAMETH